MGKKDVMEITFVFKVRDGENGIVVFMVLKGDVDFDIKIFISIENFFLVARILFILF